MKNFTRAEDVFRDLPEDIKSKIFEVAQGKLVYFPKIQNKRQNIDTERVLIDYIKGKTYNEIAEELGTNIMCVCRIIKDERDKISKKRIKYWRDQKGFSFHVLGERLYKKSHEFLRQKYIGKQEGDKSEAN